GRAGACPPAATRTTNDETRNMVRVPLHLGGKDTLGAAIAAPCQSSSVCAMRRPAYIPRPVPTMLTTNAVIIPTGAPSHQPMAPPTLAPSSVRSLDMLGASLRLLRRRAVPGHRGFHERLERARVDLLPFVDVDRPSRVAFQAGIEEARWVLDPRPPGERELHNLRVRLPGADNPVVRPDRSAHPLPLLGDLGVGFQDQRPHARQGLPAPSPQVADPLIDE